MNVFLDIVGSVILGALVILTFIQFMGEKQESQLSADYQYIVQTAMRDVTEQMQYDLRKIGYRASGCPIVLCSDSAATFVYNADGIGASDTIKYWLGGSVDGTVNPSDRFLCRQVNNGTVHEFQSGVTELEFSYFTSSNEETATPAYVRTIQVSITIQSPNPVDSLYPEIHNVFRVTPKNLR
jgi:hypothetical protein